MRIEHTFVPSLMYGSLKFHFVLLKRGVQLENFTF